MKGLHETQAVLAELFRRRKALAGDPELSELARGIASGNDRLSPAEQLEIYREQFWLRHTSSLVEDFSGLGAVIGQTAWEKLVEGYLSELPPTSHDLRDLGDRLPAYVERATWLPHHAMAVDMARVEWAYIEVFDAADVAPLTPERLAEIPEAAWESARLVLNPALRLLEVRYPVARLRRSVRLEEPWELPAEEAQKLAIYRGRDLNLAHVALESGAYAVLEELARGTPLVPACRKATEQMGTNADYIEANIARWFQDFAERAFIVAIELG